MNIEQFKFATRIIDRDREGDAHRLVVYTRSGHRFAGSYVLHEVVEMIQLAELDERDDAMCEEDLFIPVRDIVAVQ